MNITHRTSQFTAMDSYPTRQKDRECLVPRKDPILWRDWTASAPITQAQAQAYESNGYLVCKGLFSDDEIDRLIAASARLRANGQDIRTEDLVTEPGADAVRTIFRLDEHSPLFARLAADTRIADVARFLLDDEVYLHQSRLNYKPGFIGKEFYWHSDFETWHAEDGMPRMRAVSASILLTDNSALNGPLMLIPGSHRHFIACQGETPAANHKTSLKRQEVGVPSNVVLEKLAGDAGLDAATGPAGTVVFFECNTLHASNSNVTPFPRSNAFFVYNAMSNQPVAPFAAPAPRPTFLANRGAAQAIRPVRGDLSTA
ncbi:ectoine hydroxylase [Roseinatronobacter alkalisoli]|uniref:Ectoine hydroxylase n=1 Tax=Roseinatronobacter alkalisoli TaxID=3028235 RepID=A0ABT5TCQ3_9RHOB|nr:ectoine hydroxylase [Roseinatronobacter sp. HJB301]MDD7972786.1 ectoine hydroxylase [Roseinatronobacter sp. HJB301]